MSSDATNSGATAGEPSERGDSCHTERSQRRSHERAIRERVTSAGQAEEAWALGQEIGLRGRPPATAVTAGTVLVKFSARSPPLVTAVTAPVTAFAAPVTAITATASGQRALIPLRWRE